MALKLSMVNNRDLYAYDECPECKKPGQVSGDRIDTAKKNKTPLALDCGHEVSLEELP